MRRLPMWPVALLTGACAARPWTPAMSVSYYTEPVPDAITVQLPPRHQAMERWLLPPDQPWAPWTKATLLSALDEEPPPVPQALPDIRLLEVVHRAEAAALAVARNGIPPHSLWLSDLRGAASVAFVATLSARTPVAPVLTFNNWPAADEVIPTEETLAALVMYSPTLPQAAAPATPVFALDAWRLAFADDDIADATDNRYVLSPSDFPNAGQLAALGVTQVVYLVEEWSAEEVEEDDLHDVFAAWAEAGVAITVLDLRTLTGEPHLQTYVETHRYFPVPRVTIVEGDWLHRRSPGGFGGHVGPPGPSGHWGGRGGWLSGGGG
jgi:hypothetical protein